MPPRDPRECPALERSLPSDAIPDGTYRAEGIPADVLFGDGEWRQVTIVARWDDRHGTGWSEAYLYDAGKFREA